MRLIQPSDLLGTPMRCGVESRLELRLPACQPSFPDFSLAFTVAIHARL